MITNITGDILTSKANFIVHSVNPVSMDSDIAYHISEEYRHIGKEYLKYIRFCNKNHYDIVGTVQYVPVDSWALIMCDTMRNDNIVDYDIKYQYIVNMFCESASDDGIKTNIKAMKSAFESVLVNVKKLNATVAIPNSIGNIVRDIIKKYDVDVEIWR
jgi:O-acetyl-ADP-ribose deacetylase (regulator of RNase III)